MRLQILFFLVLLAIIYQVKCEGETEAPVVTEADTDEADATATAVADTTVKPTKKKKQTDDSGDDETTDPPKKKPSKKENDAETTDPPKKKPSKKENDVETTDPPKKPSKTDNGKDSKKSKGKRPNYMGHLNIYFKDKSKGGRKVKPTRIRFPVANYDRRRFPHFGPLTTFLPWLPIYVEPRSKQTIIYSPAGGVYILPPVVNFYGDMYSVAELIASGYASLVSTGTPPPASVDVAPLVQSGSVLGPNIPTVNPNTGSFNGAISTNFRSFSTSSVWNPYGTAYDYQQPNANRDFNG